MRIPPELWTKAYIRRLAAAAIPAVVAHRGDPDAGAIYVKISQLDGTAALFGPAPPALDPATPGRLLSRHFAAGTPEANVDLHLARQLEFDPDLWLVEVEDRAGRHHLEEWLARDD